MTELTEQDKEVLKDIRKEDLEILNIIAKRFKHKSWLHLKQTWKNIDNFCETDMEKAVVASRQATEEELLPYKIFYNHIANHFKELHSDWKVVCKICDKSFEQIIAETKKQAGEKKNE